jgi:membrane-bound serine protease (ClpP class)
MRPLILLLAACLLLAAPALGGLQEVAPVAAMRLEGAIDVPSAEYLGRALKQARDQGAQCLLISLNTPGGLGDPMMTMAKALLNASLPTIVYVSPAGASAFSAGTFVTLAASIAAMQPATVIGAAHPVELISLPRPEEPGAEGDKGEKVGKPSRDVMTQKVVNAFSKQIRVIAEARGRNADWAERAVRESATLSAQEALRLHVIDLLADDRRSLLTQVNGREVTLPGNRKVRLDTAHAPIVEIPPSVKESFLHVLGNPNLLLVLLVLAGLGIMFELQNPGAILPGVIGGLCLILALYSMAVLPVNYAGVGLIGFSMLLFLAEVKVVSHGILTVGGVISFVIGALMLTGSSARWLQVSWVVIIAMGLLVALFFLFVVGAAVRAHMRKVQTGREGMIRQRGRVLKALAPAGEVFVEGERWRARATEGEIREGEEIEVVGQEGLMLLVRRRTEAIPGGRENS